jgi:hypothetical protein
LRALRAAPVSLARDRSDGFDIDARHAVFSHYFVRWFTPRAASECDVRIGWNNPIRNRIGIVSDSRSVDPHWEIHGDRSDLLPRGRWLLDEIRTMIQMMRGFRFGL